MGRLVVTMVIERTPTVKQAVLTAVCRTAGPVSRRRLPSVARIEINRQVLAGNLTPDKVRALQLAPVDVTEDGEVLALEGHRS
jgi:hypothetical protein